MAESGQLINPQEAEARVAARYRVFLILWIAILASISVFLILALVVPGSGSPNQTLTFALLGVSLVAVSFSVLLRFRLVQQATENQQLQSLLSAYIIGFALCESAAIFGLLDHFLTGSSYYRFAFVIAALGMLSHFPKKEHLRAISFNQS